MLGAFLTSTTPRSTLRECFRCSFVALVTNPREEQDFGTACARIHRIRRSDARLFGPLTRPEANDLAHGHSPVRQSAAPSGRESVAIGIGGGKFVKAVLTAWGFGVQSGYNVGLPLRFYTTRSRKCFPLRDSISTIQQSGSKRISRSSRFSMASCGGMSDVARQVKARSSPDAV